MVFRQLIPSREFHSLLSYTLIQGQEYFVRFALKTEKFDRAAKWYKYNMGNKPKAQLNR